MGTIGSRRARHHGAARVVAGALSIARDRLGLLQGINSAGWRVRHIKQILGSNLETGLIIDVGANRGSFVLTCRNAGARGPIHAFEPQSELTEDIIKAGGPTTIVRTECLGREESVTSIFRDGVGDAKATTVAAGAKSDAEVLIVRQTTLDSFLDYEGIEHVDLLKVDAEGADFFVLEGAFNALSSGSIGAVACEVSWRSSVVGIFPGDIQDLLQSAGFDTFYLTSPYFGLLPVSRRIPNYEGGTSNLVAMRSR